MSESPDMRCSHRDDVAPFAIGALEHEAVDSFVAHLATCSSCQAEVNDLQGLASMLPLAAERQQPPPELKQRVMAVVRSEAELLRAAGPDADRIASQSTRPARSRWWRRLTARPLASALGGIAAAAAVVLVVIALAGGGGPDARTVEARVTIPSAQAQIELRDGSGTLVTSGMPSPSRGHVYAIWTQRAGEAARFAGTMPASGPARATLDLDGVQQVMVTVEPSRVGRTPTTSPVLTAQLT
jgi:hypothetical protein